jgi:hypothetical protein
MEVPTPAAAAAVENPISMEEYKKLIEIGELKYPSFIVIDAVPREQRTASPPYTEQDRRMQTELSLAPGDLPQDITSKLLHKEILPFPFSDPAFQQNMHSSEHLIVEMMSRILTLPHLVFASALDVLLLRELNSFVPQVLPTKRLIFNYYAILFFLRTRDQNSPPWQEKIRGIIQTVGQELSDAYRSFASVLRTDPVMSTMLASMENRTYKRPSPEDPETLRLAEHFARIEWEYLVGCIRLLQAAVMQAIGISMQAAEKYHMFTSHQAPSLQHLSPSMVQFQEKEQIHQINFMADPRKGIHTISAAIPVTKASAFTAFGRTLNHYYIYLWMEYLMLPTDHELLTPPPGYVLPDQVAKETKKTVGGRQ